jgi:hypothetical protein
LGGMGIKMNSYLTHHYLSLSRMVKWFTSDIDILFP